MSQPTWSRLLWRISLERILSNSESSLPIGSRHRLKTKSQIFHLERQKIWLEGINSHAYPGIGWNPVAVDESVLVDQSADYWSWRVESQGLFEHTADVFELRYVLILNLVLGSQNLIDFVAASL